MDCSSPEYYVDSHQHFWRLERGDYDWLGPELILLYRDFEPEQLQAELATSPVRQTIVVQAAATVAETVYLLQLAEQKPFIEGVVGWIDMESTGAVDTLRRLAENSYFKGIRPMIQDIDDPQWMLKPQLAPVFEALISQGLSFDALVKPRHLPNLATLMARYPGLDTVIDHGAKPDIAGQGFEPWAGQMAEIATNSSVYCKLSGLLAEAGDGAGIDELAPYMQHLLECFGAERLMWGSDWPVLNQVCNYANWLAITEEFLHPCNAEEKTRIMAGSATQFYRLKPLSG